MVSKNRDKLTKFRSDIVHEYHLYGHEQGCYKVMKLGDDQQLDQAVYIWFKQKRMEGVPISRPMLALDLNKWLNGESKSSASERWKSSGDSEKGTGFETCLLKARSF